jgi:hypothetical protein
MAGCSSEDRKGPAQLGIRVLPNSYVPTRSVTVHLTEPVKRAPVERLTPGPESLKPSFVERSLTVIT